MKLNLSTTLPTIDLSALRSAPQAVEDLAAELDRACREFGFFYLVGHGVDRQRTESLMGLAREFFAKPDSDKADIHMSRGGRAWRGYFRLGEELTSGVPDRKEGLYFGTELDETDPRVQARKPLHGANLFPPMPGFRADVLNYIDSLTQLGQTLLTLLAKSLRLNERYFVERYTSDPTILFRIFNYPHSITEAESLGVGNHTDYGLLTFVRQDAVGGLQVRNRDRWLDVPDVPDSFVCNVGDMLERLTNGRYLSALHRVRSSTTTDRLSMALFFDPSFDAMLAPIEGVGPDADTPHTHVRWDELDPHAADRTYGEYLLSKVGKVFPALRDDALM